MSNTQEKKFFWQVVGYQTTTGKDLLKMLNLAEKVTKLEEEGTVLKKVVDALLFHTLVLERV